MLHQAPSHKDVWWSEGILTSVLDGAEWSAWGCDRLAQR